MTTRHFGFTFGRTAKGEEKDYEELQERLARGEITEHKNESPSQRTQSSNAPNLDGFIYVPSINLYVAKERSLHGSNWDQAHQRLQADRKRMLTIPEFWNFVNYLKTGYQDKNEANRILDDIFKIGTWRAEWLDAHFEKRGEEFFVNYTHELKNGVLTPKNSDKLETCIMDSDCFANLNSVNRQGLLVIKSSTQSYVQGTNVHFWHPRDKAVAGFVAISVRAVLDCGRDRSDSDAGLGVRFACAEGTAAPLGALRRR